MPRTRQAVPQPETLYKIKCKASKTEGRDYAGDGFYDECNSLAGRKLHRAVVHRLFKEAKDAQFKFSSSSRRAEMMHGLMRVNVASTNGDQKKKDRAANSAELAAWLQSPTTRPPPDAMSACSRCLRAFVRDDLRERHELTCKEKSGTAAMPPWLKEVSAEKWFEDDALPRWLSGLVPGETLTQPKIASQFEAELRSLRDKRVASAGIVAALDADDAAAHTMETSDAHMSGEAPDESDEVERVAAEIVSVGAFNDEEIDMEIAAADVVHARKEAEHSERPQHA